MQGGKWNLIIVLALFLLAVVIVFLTIRNDCHFNEKEVFEASKIGKRDSFMYKQMDSLSSKLTETIIQLDSIRNTQKENSEMEIRNHESIKKSQNQIRRTGRITLNSMK